MFHNKSVIKATEPMVKVRLNNSDSCYLKNLKLSDLLPEDIKSNGQKWQMVKFIKQTEVDGWSMSGHVRFVSNEC